MSVYVAARLSPGLPYHELVKVMKIFSIDFHAASNVNDLMILITTWDDSMSDDHQYNPEIGPKEEVEEQDDGRDGRNLINSLLADNHNETDIPSTSQVTAHVQSGVVGRIQSFSSNGTSSIICSGAVAKVKPETQEGPAVKNEENAGELLEGHFYAQNGAGPIAQPLLAEVKEENDEYQMDFGIESGFSGAVDSLHQIPGGSAQYGMEAGHYGAVTSPKDLESVGRSVENAKNGPTKLQCRFCNASFRSLGYLARHMKVHINESATPSAPADSAQYLCDKCQMSFTNWYMYVKHCRYRCEEYRFPCDECGQRFSSINGVNKHKRVHLKSKKEFSCEFSDFNGPFKSGREN